MKSTQADQLIGKEIKVRFPRYHQERVLTIVSRRFKSRMVTTRDGGLFDCDDMELVEIMNNGGSDG